MTLHEDIEIRCGLFTRKVDIEEHTRGGTHSDRLLIFILNGKRLVPLQWHRAGWRITFAGSLKMYLPDELLREEMQKRNWLLKKVALDNDCWLGGTLIVPFTGT